HDPYGHARGGQVAVYLHRPWPRGRGNERKPDRQVAPDAARGVGRGAFVAKTARRGAAKRPTWGRSPMERRFRVRDPGGMSERSFDIVVIGTGTAGREAAGRLAQAGLSVAIVERELVGGECAFYACMP